MRVHELICVIYGRSAMLKQLLWGVSNNRKRKGGGLE